MPRHGREMLEGAEMPAVGEWEMAHTFVGTQLPVVTSSPSIVT